MDSLKSSLKNAQTLMNSFIRQKEKSLAQGIEIRLKYLTEKHSQNLVEQELINTTGRLAEIINSTPLVNELSQYTNDSNFIWESSIIEVYLPLK